MFNILSVLFLTFIGTILTLFGVKTGVEEVMYGGLTVYAVAFIWMFSSTMSSLSVYSYQHARIEELRASISKLKRYITLKDIALIDLKNYLGSTYPAIEAEVFSKITASNAGSIIGAYPDIKSSEVITNMVKSINEYNTKEYDLRARIDDDCAAIRIRNESKWEFIKASIPEDVKCIVYASIDMSVINQ